MNYNKNLQVNKIYLLRLTILLGFTFTFNLSLIAQGNCTDNNDSLHVNMCRGPYAFSTNRGDCVTGGGVKGGYFTFKPTTTDTFIIKAVASGSNPVIGIRTGACANTITCYNTSNTSTEQVKLLFTAGTNYFIFISRTVSGNFTLDSLCVNPNCTVPICTITGSTGPLCRNSNNVYTAPAGFTYLWSVTGSGTISGANNLQTVNIKAGSTCNDSFTLNLVLTNGSGCSSSCMLKAYVRDSTLPTISCPANTIVACSENLPSGLPFTGTTTDNCPGTQTISFMDVISAQTCNDRYIVTRTYVATDSCNNTKTCVQILTVKDSIAPVINCPINVTINCEASTLPANTGTATATDNCTNTVTNISSADVRTNGSCND
ncbi:MAG: hypothetical protein HOP11_13905, partial [Saprospiraceae bacterium]|nr:hypothetical protein [Saprospiraceae bacterium]